MKSISLSFICFLFFIITLVIVIKLKKGPTKRGIFFPIYMAFFSIPLYIGLYFLTPNNLYIFPGYLLENHMSVDFYNGLCLYILLCIGFVDFLIAAVTQPFSTDILVILFFGGSKGINFGEILNAYSDSSGLEHILKKRFDYLLKGSYITKKNNYVSLTTKGHLLAKLVGILKGLC